MTTLTDKLDEMVAVAGRATKGPIYQRSGNTTFPEGVPPTCERCAEVAQKPGARAIEDLLCFFDDEGEPRFYAYDTDGEFYAHAHPTVFAALCEVARAAEPVGEAGIQLDDDDGPDRAEIWEHHIAMNITLGELRDLARALTALERALEDGRG